MEKPLISIVVPVYNVEKYIERCLDSLLEQTYGNIEVVLIDDASTDGSGKICDHYAALDLRVRVVHLPENRGASRARNVGLSEARGSLTAFVDSDDYVETNMVERLYEQMLKDSADVCVCSVERMNLDGSMTFFGIDFAFTGSCQDFFVTMLKKGMFMGLGGTLCYTEAARKCGFREEIFYGEDTLFLYQMNQYAKRVTKVPERLYYYVCRPGSATHGEFNDRRCTRSYVYDFFCQESREKFPEMLSLLEGKTLDANVRLAVEAVESKTVKGRQLYQSLKQFQKEIRRYFSREALANTYNRKVALETVLLWINVGLFWGITVLYKRVKQCFTGKRR